MVSSSYRITEPHPSVPHSQVIYSGRGGAGNASHVNSQSLTTGKDAVGPASLTKLNSSYGANSSHYYASGRGGAGNIHHTVERPIFSFDEELEHQRRMELKQTPHHHVGRGGAGNYASVSERRSSAGSDSSSVISGQAVRSSIEGTWNRLRGSFSKQ